MSRGSCLDRHMIFDPDLKHTSTVKKEEKSIDDHDNNNNQRKKKTRSCTCVPPRRGTLFLLWSDLNQKPLPVLDAFFTAIHPVDEVEDAMRGDN